VISESFDTRTLSKGNCARSSMFNFPGRCDKHGVRGLIAGKILAQRGDKTFSV